MNAAVREQLQVSNSILETIGDTPLVRLKHIPVSATTEVFAKLESFNPSGSVKDRTSYNILQKAIASGDLKKGDTVIESSSGNMAIGLAQACLLLDLKLIVVVDPKLNKATEQLLQTYGATIKMVTEPLPEGGFLGARLAKVKELLQTTKNSYWSNQYGNLNNPLTHHQTTKEIYEALAGSLDYLFVATSTCGTLMGCASYIKEHHPQTKIIAVDAVGSVLFGGEAGPRNIPGHGAGVTSQFLNEHYIHDFIKVNDLECAMGCWELLKKESILVGGSSGAIISAFHKYESQLEEGARCALLLSDGGNRYLDTIYNQEWLLKHIPGVYDSLTPIGGWKVQPVSEFNVAIIGVGPKGLYGLERLLATIKEAEIEGKIHIHLYNKNHFFGAGDVYRTNQPSYLKMNFANEKIDIRPTTKPEPITSRLKNYVSWLSDYLEEEESSLTKKISSRSTVGKYLSYCFEVLVAEAPKNVKFHEHTEEVVAISRKDEFLQIETSSFSHRKEIVQVNQLLLTTGHAGNLTPVSAKEKKNASTIDFIYPVSRRLLTVHTNSVVAIKGMGLTFIDACLALTEGREGSFLGKAEEMHYIKSGNEPRLIYPYSRSGAPMIPRVGAMPSSPSLRFFTVEHIHKLKKNSSYKFNFEEELLPLIQKEFTYRYYKLAFKNAGETLTDALAFEEMQKEIETFHHKHPAEKGFNFDELKDPFSSNENYNSSTVRQYLEETLAQVSLASKSPLLAAISAWHDISPIFNELYSFGGLTAKSHQVFDTEYAPFFNRISYGPPLENMYKMLALLKVELLDFTFGKSPQLEQLAHQKLAISTSLSNTNHQVEIDYHIDARIPKMNMKTQCSRLYQHLLKSGLVRPFQNVDAENSYFTGGIDLTENGNPIDEEGKVIDNITVYGTPTEGVTFDNDSLSRSRNDFGSIWAKNAVKAINTTN
ncbi:MULTISPECIES: 2,3-diaminopropionate biosynthesis protein SbnA [Mesonia]|uniref:Siderophore biosynthesis protein SbnA n=1 Tax=Mesonia oceanica TaxID=2687242 RepID=A0AC61Y7E5_9FLAO|nr:MULTISPECIES: 2,3-diaminopropionate biosynthesis protein SbnA [Mesonia]VVV00431.1 putative siderophore biosynthesis protein SbnA [Mesonia oceanica]|tara:strand:+ start:2653 stop:5454 length:2802 start_codon:yes stop_codon:yes gene_type:complete